MKLVDCLEKEGGEPTSGRIVELQKFVTSPLRPLVLVIKADGFIWAATFFWSYEVNKDLILYNCIRLVLHFYHQEAMNI